MRIRRDINSIPHRSAGDTWQCIIDLATGQGSKDVSQLHAASSVMATIITDQHPAARAIIIEGVGAQLRIYCRYGMEAIEDGSAVDPLTWNPTAGEWTMHVPCDLANIAWVKQSLSSTSPRIRVFDVDECDRAEEKRQLAPAKAGAEIVVDWNFGRKR